MDVVEVLRGTTVTPLLQAASALGGIAAVATVLAVVAWWRPPRTPAASRPGRWLLEIAFAVSTAELALLVLDGASLGARWSAAVLVRLLFLVALAVLPTPPGPTAEVDPAPDGDRASRPLALLSTVGLLVTAVLGAPTSTGALPGGVTGLLIAAGATATVVVVGGGVLRFEARNGRPWLAIALLLVLSVPAAVALTPDRLPPHQQTQLAAAGLQLDLTVAPVRAGTNEFHLYAFGPDGAPAPVTDVTVAVEGAPDSRHGLFPVSPDHHLSYVLELPASPPWVLEVRLTGPDGEPRQVRWTVQPPG